MDFNKLIAMIKELSGGDLWELKDLLKDGDTIHIELKKVPHEELIKEQ